MTATPAVSDVTVDVNACSPHEWRFCASLFADHNIYQTTAYAQQRAGEMGAENASALIRRGNELIGMAQVRIKRLPVVHAGVAYVFRGPLWRRSSASAGDLAAVLGALYERFGTRDGLEIRLVPAVTDLDDPSDTVAALRSRGFEPRVPQTREQTIYLDLDPDLDTLRQGLAQKWRNGLNQSLKKGITVETRTDDEAMATFQALYDEMWTGKRFETGVSVSSFRRVQAVLHAEEKLAVSLAYGDGAVIAGHVSSQLGDTCIYLLGASNEEGRKRKASYLLQWKTIEHAKAAGARWYDLGGIDPEANPGVYHFKSGLGGRTCSFVGESVPDVCCCHWRKRRIDSSRPSGKTASASWKPKRRYWVAWVRLRQICPWRESRRGGMGKLVCPWCASYRRGGLLRSKTLLQYAR